MGFLRTMATQAIGVASMGAAAAILARLFGLDKSTVIVGMGGAVVGWCCCWLYAGWVNTKETRSRDANDARLMRSALQRTEIDHGIRIAMPLSSQHNDKQEERP